MKTRRGISSVVGTVFAIIALATTITYVTYSLDVLDKFNQGVLSKNEETLDRGKEDFDVLSANIKNSKFNITISNTGTLPIEITKMWVQNKSTTDWVNGYDVGKSVSPDGVLTNIGKDISLYASTTNAYDIRLVTSRGNTKEFSVNSGSSQPLYLQLHALPSKVATGFTTTLLFEVVNNQSSNDLLLNLKPKPLVVTPQGTAIAVLVPGSWPIPTTYSSLSQGDVAYFKWIYDISGKEGETVTFQAELENGYPNNKATAVTTLKDVGYATESGTSIESEGLTCCRTSDDIIVFHAETYDTPGGAYQMYSGSADITGFTIDLETLPSVSFFTNNDTVSTVDVPTGNWNVTFRYRSSAMPDALQANLPNMIFHFTSHNPATPDSSGYNNALTVSGAVHNATGGVHQLGYYKFDGSDDYMNIPYSLTHNGIGSADDSTAGWFKVSGGNPLTEKIIYDIEGTQVPPEYYKIAIEAVTGKLVFEFKPDATVVTCKSASSVSNGNWQHFVAVRTADKACTLYINGTNPQSSNPGGTGSVDTASPGVYIGRDKAGTLTSYFSGSIDYIMHWNSWEVTAAQALELYNANYGTKSHTVDITLVKTDKNGNIISELYPLSVTKQNFNFTFGDGQGSSTKWASQNYTVYLTNSTDPDTEWHFTPNQRLKLNVAWDAAANDGELDMDWRIDDNTLTNQVVSILQTPLPPFGGFASYYLYDNDNDLNFAIENTGPDGIWIIYAGSRVMFENVLGGTSYAGLIFKWNGTKIDTETDSRFLPVYNRFDLLFYKPRLIPTSSPSDQAVVLPGNYRMYVSIVGYDEKGSNVFRTFYVGIVRVVE